MESDLFFFIFQNICRLAIQFPADGLQRGQPDGFYFTGFKYGKVYRSQADSFCQFIAAHFPLGQHYVQVNDDRHIKKLGPVLPAGARPV